MHFNDLFTEFNTKLKRTLNELDQERLVIYILKSLHYCFITEKSRKECQDGSHKTCYDHLLWTIANLRLCENGIENLYLQVLGKESSDQDEAMIGGLKHLLSQHPTLAF